MVSLFLRASEQNHQIKVTNDSIKQGFFHKRRISIKMKGFLIKIKALMSLCMRVKGQFNISDTSSQSKLLFPSVL